jgi:hypothetical protein
VKPGSYFAAEDVPPEANLLGTLSFFFACYGVGTPMLDDYARLGNRPPIADRAFIAALPRRLLARGVLAAVGHVERAWGYSFIWEKNRTLQTFQDALSDLAVGFPIGAAMEWFNERYAEAASNLTSQLQEMKGIEEAGGVPDVNSADLTGLWTTQNDARGYVVLGDPAVKLLVADGTSKPVAAGAYVVTSYEAPADLPPLSFSAPLTAAEAATPSNSGEAVNFGFWDKDKDPKPNREQAEADQGRWPVDKKVETQPTEAKTWDNFEQFLKEFGDKVGAFLNETLDKALNLEIETYTGDNLTIADLREKAPKATLAAATRIELNGNTRLVVPTNDSGVDQDLWALHMEMVKQAQTSRSELIKNSLSLVSNLLPKK